jgi:hypothetical protein
VKSAGSCEQTPSPFSTVLLCPLNYNTAPSPSRPLITCTTLAALAQKLAVQRGRPAPCCLLLAEAPLRPGPGGARLEPRASTRRGGGLRLRPPACPVRTAAGCRAARGAALVGGSQGSEIHNT